MCVSRHENAVDSKIELLCSDLQVLRSLLLVGRDVACRQIAFVVGNSAWMTPMPCHSAEALRLQSLITMTMTT